MLQKKVSATIHVTAVIDGQDGPEGNGIQSVTRTYAVSSQATTASDTTPPSDITSWAAASPATTVEKPYLWAKEVVTYTKAASTTKYYMIGARGQNGIDAQDFEWVYIRTKTNTAPVIATDSSYTDSKGKTYTADDHLPHVTGNSNIESDNSGVSGKTYECSDDPKGVNDTWPYEWEIKREKGTADANGHRAWQPYSGTMTLHNNLAASLLAIDIDNDSDQFGVDADGKVLVQQARSTVVTMAYGTEPQAFTAAPTASLRYDDGSPVDTTVVTADVAVVANTDNTQYRVTVTVKATGTAAAVFGTSGKSGLYVDISGACSRGTKSVRFSLTKVMGGASGENPVIWQLNPSKKSFVFGRDASNNLTPASVSSSIYVTRTEGNTATEHTSTSGLTNPPTFSWGFDSSSTAQASGRAIGTAISISNTQAASHSSVWVKLSTGDRETLPILKDGAKGDILSLRCSAAVVSFKENSQGIVTGTPATYNLSLVRTVGETTTVLNAVPTGYSLKFKEGADGEWNDGQSLGTLNSGSELLDGQISELSYGLFRGNTLLQSVKVVSEWPEKGDNGDKGDDAVIYSLQCSPAAVNFRSDAVGEFSGSYTVGCKVMKTVGNNTTEVAASSGTYDGMYLKCRKLNTSGNYTSWNAASSATLTPSDALTNNYVAVEFALSANSGMTDVKARVSVPIMCDGHRGAPGEPGATGKMFYPMGAWNAQTTYSRTGDLVPLVFLPDPGNYNETIGAEGHYFYLYDDTNIGTRPVVNDSTNPWRLCDTFGVVITQGLFAEFAKMGKGIFSGDYFFSMNGRIFTSATNSIEKTAGATYTYNGVTKPAYTWFKGDPSEQTTYPYFEPNWWVDLLTGKMSAARGNFIVEANGDVTLNNAYINGTAKASIIYRSSANIRIEGEGDPDPAAEIFYYDMTSASLLEKCAEELGKQILPNYLILTNTSSAVDRKYFILVHLPSAHLFKGHQMEVYAQCPFYIDDTRHYPGVMLYSDAENTLGEATFQDIAFRMSDGVNGSGIKGMWYAYSTEGEYKLSTNERLRFYHLSLQSMEGVIGHTNVDVVKRWRWVVISSEGCSFNSGT